MNINTPKEAVSKKSKKKSVVVIVVLILLCAGGYFYFSVPKTKKEVIIEEIAVEKPQIQVSWEFPDITMDVGETREIKWVSDRKIYPNISHERKAVNIIGFIDSGIIISAVKSDVEKVVLRIEGKEVPCTITVNEAGK